MRFGKHCTVAVAVAKGGLADPALQDEELMPQRKDLDVLAAVSPRQQSKQREGVGRGEAGQARRHDRP
jgi:hypothetical protein